MRLGYAPWREHDGGEDEKAVESDKDDDGAAEEWPGHINLIPTITFRFSSSLEAVTRTRGRWEESHFIHRVPSSQSRRHGDTEQGDGNFHLTGHI